MALAAGQTGHLADHQEAVYTVVHGATAGTTRPTLGSASTSPTVVKWIGSVEPTNAVNNDEWFDTGNSLVKVKVSGSFVTAGSGTYLPVLNAASYVTGDGTTDDAAGLTSAAAAAVSQGRTLFIPGDLTVKVDSTVDLTAVVHFRCEGALLSNVTAGPGFEIGGDSSVGDPSTVFIKTADHSGTASRTQPTVRVQGLKNGQITIVACDWLQLYADGSDATISSIAYSTFYLGKIDTLELYGENGTAWINENTFVGGRYTTILLDGSYPHNGNVWLHPKIEGASSEIDVQTGHSNRWENVRGESGTTATFGSGTHHNRITHHWYSTASSSEGTVITVSSDAGTRNHVERPAGEADFIWIPSGGFEVAFGSPSIISVANSWVAWAFDAAANEQVGGGMWDQDRIGAWDSVDVVAVIFKTTTNNGDVVLIGTSGNVGVGETLSGTIFSNTTHTVSTTQWEVEEVTLASGVAIDPSKPFGFKFGRRGDLAADTLSGDLGFLGYKIVKAS